MPHNHDEFWRAVYDCFDPAEPVRDPELRAPRPERYNQVARMAGLLAKPLGHRRYFVAGGVGSGKTTELIATAQQLSKQRIVVYVDIWEHLSATVGAPAAINHLQTWELLGLLGMALTRAGTERFGHQWADEPDRLGLALSAFDGTQADSPQVEIDAAKLATGMTVLAGGALGGALGGPAGAAGGAAIADTALKLLEAAGGAVTWRWRIGLKGRAPPSDQDQRVRDVLRATNALVLSLQEDLARRIVLFIDGLDRVRDAATFEALFVESGLLRELDCDMVVCLHLALVERFVGRLDQFDRRFDLVNVPVARQDEPHQHGEGVAFFDEVVRRRLARIDGDDALPDALPPDLVRRLAWCSGGRLRDFMRLVRALAEEAWPDATTISDDLADRVIDEHRRNKESGLNAEQIRVLAQVLADPAHRLPGGDVALELVNRQLLLAYPNRSAWYLPHPLLLMLLLDSPVASSGHEE